MADEGKPRKSMATKLIEIANEVCSKFFVDSTTGQPYVAIKIDDGLPDPDSRFLPVKVMQVDGEEFKRTLAHAYYREYGKAVNSEALKSAVNVITAEAQLSRELIPLSLRVAQEEDAIYYDLHNQDNEIVTIGKDGWEVIQHTRPIFKHYSHMLPQVKPKNTEPDEFKRLLRHVRIANGESIVFLVAVASYLLPEIPKPMLIFYGPQGSTKTTTEKMIKALVDPSALSVLSVSKKYEDVVQALAHHYLVAFDNISKLPRDIQDLLCRAVTGEGYTKRKLYTDDDEVVYNFKRAIVLNGINIPGENPDFLDRAILCELERVPVTERKEEAEVWQEFYSDLPHILGGLFSTISGAMKLYPEVREELRSKAKPRMADFCVWGEAIGRALGYEPFEFYEAYMAKVRAQNMQALSADVIGELVIEFMRERDRWEGTASELLAELKELAETHKVDTKVRGFPKVPHALTRKLNILKVNLAEEGIVIEYDRVGKSGKRLLKLYCNKASEVSERQNGPGEKADAMADAKDSSEKASAKECQLVMVPEEKVADATDAIFQDSLFGDLTPDEARSYLEAFNLCKWHAWGSDAYRTEVDQWDHAVRVACDHIDAKRRVEIGEALGIREVGIRVEIPTASVELLKQIAAGGGGKA